MAFIVKKGKVDETAMDELDIARIEYEQEYKLEELSESEPEEAEKFTGIGLGNVIDPGDGKPAYCALSFYDDNEETKITTFVTLWKKRAEYKIKDDNALFPVIQALAQDKESVFFVVDFAELQKELKKVTSVSIISAIKETRKGYEYPVPIIVDIQM